jgi:hypothetical protein
MATYRPAFVLDARGAQAVATLHRCVGYCGDTRFLHSHHDLGVERLERRFSQSTGNVAEADNVDRGWKTQFQIRVGRYPLRQIACVGKVLIKQATKFGNALFLKCHPDLERPKPARSLTAKVVQQGPRSNAARSAFPDILA